MPTNALTRRARPRAALRSAPARRRAPVRLSLLGEFRVVEEGRVHSLPRAARRLVALVALYRPTVSRAIGAALLTPHLEPASAAGSLRAALARLRSQAPPLVETDATSLRLAPNVQVDVTALETLVDPLRTASALDVGLDDVPLDQELLPGWDDQWVVFRRERLRELSIQELERRATRLAEQGEYAAAIATTYIAIGVDPLRETTARLLIDLHLREGNQAQAVRAFIQFQSRLVDALGVEPTEATRARLRPLLDRMRRHPIL